MRKRSTWVAWALLAVWTASVVAFLLLSVSNGNFQRQPLADTVGLLLAFAAFMVVGALIVAHRPGNAVGWVFSAIGLLAVTGALAEEYAGYAVLTRPGSLPGGVLAGWYAGWAWYPTFALVVAFTPLLSPTAGHRRPAGGRSPGWPEPERRRSSPSPPCSPPSSWTTGTWSTTRSGWPRSATPSRAPSASFSPARSASGRGRGGVAGRPVPPLPGRGAPPAQVVHLRRRPSWAVAGATLAVATPPAPWTPSAPACATRSTWTPSRPSCWGGRPDGPARLGIPLAPGPLVFCV